MILQARITRANYCHHDGRPRGAMSTLFALEGVNFFDAFTFEAVLGCRVFSPRRQILVTQKKEVGHFGRVGLYSISCKQFFFGHVFWKGGTLKFQ